MWVCVWECVCVCVRESKLETKIKLMSVCECVYPRRTALCTCDLSLPPSSLSPARIFQVELTSEELEALIQGTTEQLE